MSEREEWHALATADTLHMLPVTALVASIQHLATELLRRPEDPRIAAALALSDEMVTEFIANIPLSPPDRTYDPHDEFKRCAVDRASRAKRWAGRIRAALTADNPSLDTERAS